MKILSRLPQFRNKTALLIVTGIHKALMYGSRDGEIEKIGEIDVPYPRYSDRESFFESAGHGKIFFSGAVYEVEKVETRKKFLKELEKNEKLIISKEQVTHIYIFSPMYVVRSVIGTLPKEMRQKVRRIFVGNYTHEHPFGLLGRIKQQKEAEEHILPTKKEARDILSRNQVKREKEK